MVNDNKHSVTNPSASMDAKTSQSPPEAGGFGSWGWTPAMPALSWNSIVETVKKQTDAVATVLERDITDFITIVAPSNDSAANNSSADELSDPAVIDAETGVVLSDDSVKAPLAGESTIADTAAASRTASFDDHSGTPTAAIAIDQASVVTDTVARLEALVESAEGLIDSGVGSVAKMVESVDVTHAVERIEKLADRAEDFLESVETGVWNFVSSAISNASSLLPTDIVMRSGSAGTTKSVKSNIIYDRKTATIMSLRHAQSTYIEDPLNITPSGSPAAIEKAKRYADFKDTFQISLYSTQISRLFDEDVEMRALLTQLVPSSLTYEEFWLRYFFQISELEREEETRKKLISDVEQNAEEVDWDDGSSQEEEEKACAEKSQKASTSANSQAVNETKQQQPPLVKKPEAIEPIVPASNTEAVAAGEQELPAIAENVEAAMHKKTGLSKQTSTDEKRTQSLSEEEKVALEVRRRDLVAAGHSGGEEGVAGEADSDSGWD
ncbi:BSD domain-containing protein 1 [Entophlyctis sp. JEL0112]|nr:BSD domain-containing protein 1 [Entophlyctis sp. JEL0112]